MGVGRYLILGPFSRDYGIYIKVGNMASMKLRNFSHE